MERRTQNSHEYENDEDNDNDNENEIENDFEEEASSDSLVTDFYFDTRFSSSLNCKF
jgi:hypothetical protein